MTARRERGLRRGSQPAHARDDEYGDPAIGSHVWNHLLAISERLGENTQLPIIDNRPRPQAASAVSSRYSGVPGEEPHGLIDNEVP